MVKDHKGSEMRGLHTRGQAREGLNRTASKGMSVPVGLKQIRKSGGDLFNPHVDSHCDVSSGVDGLLPKWAHNCIIQFRYSTLYW